MHVTIQLLIVGITVGSACALAALGLVVVYNWAILVDHDVDFASAACQRTYAMALGQVVASGETPEVPRSEPVVEPYLGPVVTAV